MLIKNGTLTGWTGRDWVASSGYTFRPGPESSVQPDKELFLAEYKSLRDEILLRVGQLTTLSQIALTAWGVILGSALTTKDSDILFIYPLLAYFINFSWAFNSSRIYQIGKYLKCREEHAHQHFGMIYWESYVASGQGATLLIGNNHARRRPGIAIFLGSQFAAIMIALLIFFSHPAPSPRQCVLTAVLFLSGIAATLATAWNIEASETDRDAPKPKRLVW